MLIILGYVDDFLAVFEGQCKTNVLCKHLVLQLHLLSVTVLNEQTRKRPFCALVQIFITDSLHVYSLVPKIICDLGYLNLVSRANAIEL